jgi:hypothetical protein
MKKIAVLVAGVCLTATTVLAADGEPMKAGGYKSDMVRPYADCTMPSEVTLGALPFPSCPATTPNPICQFGAKGKATVQAKAKTDVALQAQLSGLENCDGATLKIAADISAATNNCSVSSRCHTIKVSGFQIGSCVVAKGKCKIKTTVNTEIAGAITTGKNTSIEIDRVGITTGTVNVAVSGVLIP